MRIFDELKRRNVFRVALAYLAVSWLIVQVAETVFPAFDIESVTLRVLLISLSVGFLPVLMFAWIFEWTAGGLKLERDVDRSESRTGATGKILDRIVILILAIALSYFVFDKFLVEPARDAEMIETARQQGRAELDEERREAASIAVLPFADLSPAQDHQYFSDGLAEELLNLLAKIEGLRVTSRTSSFSFAGTSADIPGIASALDVSHVLQGSVRRHDDRLRVTVQLIDADSDSHIWSHTFDQQMRDIFEMQDQIAASVVESLRISMAGDLPESTVTEPEAFALFLQARHFWRQGSEASIQTAHDLLQNVLEIDPMYANAWNGLSTVYTYQAGLGNIPLEEGYLKAREASKRALEIDPTDAEALASLGWDAMFLQNDIRIAASYFRSAQEQAPNNPMVLGNVAMMAAVMGRLEYATELMESAIRYDPVDSAKYTNLGAFHMAAGKLDEAESALSRAAVLSPDDVWAQMATGLLQILQNRPADALTVAHDIEQKVFRLKLLPMALHTQGRHEEAIAALDELVAARSDGVSYYDIAEVNAHLGLVDEAFAALGLALEQKDEVIFIRTSAFLGELASDPRWTDVLTRLGLADEQVSSVQL